MNKLRLLDSDVALDAVLCALPAPVEPRTAASDILAATAPITAGAPARSLLVAHAPPLMKAACLLLVGGAVGWLAGRALQPAPGSTVPPALAAAVTAPITPAPPAPTLQPAITVFERDDLVPADIDGGSPPAAPRVPIITRNPAPLAAGGEALEGSSGNSSTFWCGDPSQLAASLIGRNGKTLLPLRNLPAGRLTTPNSRSYSLTNPNAPGVAPRPPVDTVVIGADDRWWDGREPVDLLRPAVARDVPVPTVSLETDPSASAVRHPWDTHLRFGGQVVASPMFRGGRVVGPAAQVGITHLGPGHGLARPRLLAQVEVGGLSTSEGPRFLGGAQAGAGVALDSAELRFEVGWLVGARLAPTAGDPIESGGLPTMNLLTGPQLSVVVQPEKGPAFRFGTSVLGSVQQIDDRAAIRPWLSFTAGIELPIPRKS